MVCIELQVTLGRASEAKEVKAVCLGGITLEGNTQYGQPEDGYHAGQMGLVSTFAKRQYNLTTRCATVR